MDKTRRNIIPVIILLSAFTVPLFFNNRLINVNTIHGFLFSANALTLIISLFFFKFKYFILPQFRILFVSIGLFLLFLFLSSSVNNRFILGLEDIALYFNIFIFAYLIFLCFQLYDFDKLLYYISIIVSSVCTIVSLLGILEFFNINILSFQFNLRPGSTLSIRNFASEYAVIALPFLLLINFINKNLLIKILLSLFSLIILVFIFFCRTRSSFVVLIAYVLIILFFLFYNKFPAEQSLRKVFLYIIFAVVISGIIGSYIPPNIDKERANLNNTIISVFDRDLPENYSRVNYLKTALRIFRDEPITGIGAGSWFGIYPKYNGNMYTDENVLQTSELNPHNDYLETLSENGIFGFIFFVVILFIVGKNLYEKTKNNIIILPVLLSFSGFLIVSLFSFPKDNVSMMMLLSTSIGISLCDKDREIKNELLIIKIKTLKSIIIGVLTVILIAITIFGFYRFKYEATYLKALNYKAEGNYKSMIEKFDNINSFIFPADANRMPIEFYKGVGYFELKNYNEALNSFKIALELAPSVPVILSNTATSFYTLKDNENAFKILLQLQRKFPLFIEPQINLLAIYTNTGQDSLAKMLLINIENKSVEHQYIKNYNVLEKIKDYYNEKNPH
jgi:O-antigen ligase